MPQGPFRSLTPLVLASASPRRQRLLASLGLDFEVHPSRITEAPPAENADPGAYTAENASLKAAETSRHCRGHLVLGADTVVVCDGRILGKPVDEADAVSTLERLAGRTHEVVTACCLLRQADGAERRFQVRTRVSLSRPDAEQLRSYAATGEPMDKAGSYAIQGIGAFLVREIHGSYTNVVGLPLQEVCQALLELEAIRPADPEELRLSAPS